MPGTKLSPFPAGFFIPMTTIRWKYISLSFFLFLSLTFPSKENLEAGEPARGLFQRAEELLQGKRYSDALALYEKILTYDPAFIPAYRGIVSCYKALGNAQGAVIYAESLLLEHPESAEVSYGLGYAFYNIKKYQEANSYFEKAIKLNPELAEAWNNSAAIYQFVTRDYEKARAYYEKAITISKKTNNVRVLEIAEENLSHLPQADEKLTPVTEHLTLEAFVNRFVAGVDTKDERGVRQLVLGQRENSVQAVDWFLGKAVSASAEVKRADEKTMVFLAKVLEKEYSSSFGDTSLQNKIAFYENLNDEQKQNMYKGEGLLKEGLQKEQEGLYEEAQSRYEEAQRCFEPTGEKGRVGLALLSIGDVHRKLKHYALAQEAYRKALTFFDEVDDSQREALVLSSIGITYYFLGEYEKAMESLNRSSAIYHTLKDEEAERKVHQNIELINSKIKR